jgi:predicted GIY-YIG superfamily endonuclease
MDIKKIKANFHKNWLKQLEVGEKKQDKIWFDYLNGEANKIIDEFLANNKNIQNVDAYYTLDQFENLYIGLYKDIGLRMANWYMNNYEKYIRKQDASQFQDIWSEKFAFIGKATAGERIVSVSGNRKKELIKTLNKYMANPEFQVMNERQAQRVLRKKFKHISIVNAKRIIRTESVNAANYATNQSAIDIFGKDNLQKEWIATRDNRTRLEHIEADGQIVKMEENFIVGGQKLERPGDPSGSAWNVINCRCTTAPFPIEVEQNVSSGRIIDIVGAVAQTVATVAVVEEILDSDTPENN